MSLYEGSVKRPIFTALCFVAIVVFGVFSYTKLPIDQLPDIESNTIMVFTYYNGANASDIENNVTRPLENTLNSCTHIKHITSRSSENVSVITLEFEYGHSIDDLTNDVRDKLSMISNSLPDGAGSPIIFKFDTSMMPIMLLSVQAGESQSALYKILDENVVNPLARIPGVGTVSVTGAPQREIYVYCDPAKLEALSKVGPYAGCTKDAPAAIVSAYRKECRMPEYAQIDLSIAMENLWLETDAQGLGGVWLGIAPLEDRMKEVETILGLPGSLRAFAIFPYGYPAEQRTQEDRFDAERVHFV